MELTPPVAYRMSLTAAEVEELLLSVYTKIPLDIIRTSLENPSDETIPTTKAVADALGLITGDLEYLGDLALLDVLDLGSSKAVGVLPISKGGTGGGTVELAQQNLGIVVETAIQAMIDASIPAIQSVDLGSAQATGVLPLSKGGTGATGASQARVNLGVWSSEQSRILEIKSLEALRRSYAEAGYNVVGTFQAGGTVTSGTDVLIDEATGVGCTFTGIYPHTVAVGETPASAGWTPRSDEQLRTQLLAGAVAVRNGVMSLRDLVSVKDFGAAGNGVVDDTLAFIMWLAYLLSTGAKGFIPEGKYLTRTLTASNGTKGLHIEAAGWHATEIIRHPESTDGAVIRISYTPGVYLSGFKTNAQHDVTVNATTGIILKDCPNSILYRVWSHNTGILGILAHHPNDVAGGDDLSYMVRGVHFIKCRSSDTVGGGLQMVGCSESGMEGCLAERAGTTGIYFKCPIRRCYSSNNQTVDALTGTSLGTDYGTAQTGEQLTITNFRAKDVLTTARFNCMRDSEITNITGFQTGDNTDGFGDGIRLENSFDNSFKNVNIKNVAPSRAAARFTSGSARNEVQLSNTLLLAGAFNSRFEAGTSNNLVKASRLIGDPTARRSQDIDNANTHIEEFVVSAVFSAQLSVNVAHNLKYDTIPLHRLTFWFSAPPPSAPAVAMVSENSISITFASPYTGTVKLSLQ